MVFSRVASTLKFSLQIHSYQRNNVNGVRLFYRSKEGHFSSVKIVSTTTNATRALFQTSSTCAGFEAFIIYQYRRLIARYEKYSQPIHGKKEKILTDNKTRYNSNVRYAQHSQFQDTIPACNNPNVGTVLLKT